MRDFILKIYNTLLNELMHAGYEFVSFMEYIQNPGKKEKTVILRHDVDKKPLRSLRTAEMESAMGIHGTYYFRILKSRVPAEVIRKIAALGHEIGYHYDDLNDAGGVVAVALDLFQANLARLRELAPIKTACMHGSPLSRFDNRDLWKERNYIEFGIIGEPYFDIDFNELLYLTDTGRRWDGDRVSIRDKAVGAGFGIRGKRKDRGQKTEDREELEKERRGAVYNPPIPGYEEVVSNMNAGEIERTKLHSTMDIINAARNDQLPEKIMLTVHSQRWTDQYFPWIWELCWQNVKNSVKYLLLKAKT